MIPPAFQLADNTTYVTVQTYVNRRLSIHFSVSIKDYRLR